MSGALMNGISVFVKEIPDSSFAPSTMRGHSEKSAIYEPGSGFSPNARSAGALFLDFPNSRTAKNNFQLLYKPLSLCYFFRAAQMDQDIQ